MLTAFQLLTVIYFRLVTKCVETHVYKKGNINKQCLSLIEKFMSHMYQSYMRKILTVELRNNLDVILWLKNMRNKFKS